MTTAIEMVSYKTNESATQDVIDKAQQQINEFCMQQPGFIYRSLSCDEQNTWYDIVYWQNMQAAQAASDAFGKTQICHEIGTWINESTVTMTHMPVNTEIMGAISSDA